jgi:MFS family permease
MMIKETSNKLRAWQIPAMLIWLVAALGVPYQFVLQSTPNVMIAKLMSVMHINESSVGFITSSFFYTYLLFQVPAGILIDRFGVRRVLSASIFFAAFACILFANSRYFVVADATRMLMGFVTAPCVPAIMYVASKRFSPSQFVILAGLAESIGMMGGAFGEAILGTVVTHIGWQETMTACGLFGFVVALLMFAIIRDTKTAILPSISAGQELKYILTGFKSVMKNSQIWLIVWWGGLIFAMLPALAGLWIVQVLQDLYGLKLAIAALGSSVMFMGTAIGLPFWGWFSERIKKRRPVMFIATTINIVLTCSFIYWRHIPLPIVFIQLTLMGFVSAVYVLAFALVRERTADCVRASAMGWTNMMTMLVGAPLLQPLIGGVLGLFHKHGDKAYSYALSSISICLVLALVLIFFIKETHCRQQKID